MASYTYFGKNGMVQFQFSIYQVVNKKRTLQNQFVSNLSFDLLKSINPKVIQALISESELVPKMEQELMELLSVDIKNSELAECFYYPDWVLKGIENDDELLEKYLKSQQVQSNQKGVFYTKEYHPLTLYALANQMRNARWFKQIAFKKSFIEIQRGQFEEQLNRENEELVDSYVSLYNDGEYFFTIRNDRTSVSFYIQTDADMEPNLIFTI